jgi:2-amino-4-hydroxy-6-hydroxymethyldihydropteridine diphosphokinase
MNLAYLITGSNLGDKLNNLQQAQLAIQTRCGHVLKKSGIYETAAWGKTNQPSFYNQVIFIQTTLAAGTLLEVILEIERSMGRIRMEKYAARIIDIDILFFNHEIVDTGKLTIPHPEISRRRFVLEPLAELVPKKIHPVYKRNIEQLLQQCADNLTVTRIHS